MKSPAELNILMATPRYYPYMGGIETHVYEVGWRLVQLGHRITILTTAPGAASSTFPREEESRGMRIIRVPAWPRRRDYYFAPEIRTIIKSEKWDLVHCQGCHTFVPPLAMLAARENHIPYILTFHTGGHSSKVRNSIRSIQWNLMRPLLAGASRLIGVSRFEADYFCSLLHLPSEKFTVIANGSSLPALPSGQTVSTQGTLIASIGRLERYKGHQRLIAALPKIREWRPDARLLIVGIGPYEGALRELARRIHMEEFVEFRSIPASDRQAMAEFLSQITLVALLSDYEAHPLAVMEALSLKRPVLVTETSGLKELADQGLARSIPLQSSPDEVALAVRRQIEEPVLPPPSFSLPTWDSCASQLQEIYHASVRSIKCVS